MTDAEKAYAKAEEMIAEALVEGLSHLSFDDPETHALEVLPPQIGDLVELLQVDCSNTKISNLSPLSSLKGLEILMLNGAAVSDLSGLSVLTTLDTLQANQTQISDLSPLRRVANLAYLYFDGTNVSDLSPLSNLTRLREVDLNGTLVSDLSPLSGMLGLKELRFDGTLVSDLSPISKLLGLKELWFSKTRVSDLSPLSNLTLLDFVTLNETDVLDLRPLSKITQSQGTTEKLRVFFEDCEATRIDWKIRDISEVEGIRDRLDALIDYLEDWETPGEDAKKQPSPKVPKEKPSPLRTDFSEGRMVRTVPANLPEDDALQRAEKGWHALKAYRAEFGDSFNVHNYAPLPSFLGAFDRAMGEIFDPENLIMIGVMGSRITRLSRNAEFVSCLPTGADTDLQGFGAAIALYLERFNDWTEYQDDADQSGIGLDDVVQHVDDFEEMAKALRETSEIDVSVSDEYSAELAEMRDKEADDAVAQGFDASNRELVRNLAEKGIEEVKSGRLVRKSVDDMDKMADGEFTKLKLYSYGWTLVVLKRNQAPLRRMSKRYSWLGPVLDYLVGDEAPSDNEQT